MTQTSDVDWNRGAAWINGDVVPIADASIPVTDWGLTHSDITYDVVHAWDGRFFRIDDYLDRFQHSLEKLRLSVPQSKADIKAILHQMVGQSGLRRAYVSMVVSRGQPSMPGSRDPRLCANHFYAWCVPFVWVFLEEVVERGAHIMIPDHVSRISDQSVDPTAKNYHWGDFTEGLFTAKEAGFDNTMLLDAEGNVTEGPGFNVFIVKHGKVRTAARGVLEGITRKVAMEICAHHNITCETGIVSKQDLMEADEVFATTTGGGIVSITKVNDRVFSNGAPGEIAQRVQHTYWEWHNDPSMSETIHYAE